MKKIFSIFFLLTVIFISIFSCSKSKCKNDGVLKGGNECDCTDWTYGDFCENDASKEVLGTYNVVLTSIPFGAPCTNTAYEIIIEPATSVGANFVKIKNFDNTGADVIGTVSYGGANYISISDQVISGGLIGGGFVFNTDKITGTIQIIHGSFSSGQICNGSMSKKL